MQRISLLLRTSSCLLNEYQIVLILWVTSRSVVYFISLKYPLEEMCLVLFCTIPLVATRTFNNALTGQQMQ